ncbi:MAG: hypothetical protein PHQ91_00050 [Thermoanaerobaculaceae bacterium]|nr:hypothetical protein [Thermoanaerobaculaceae bacterium]TAM48118.1 MAG: hypothetical protein EPN53_10645 [Acidobacteriota bacterium]
MRTALKTFVTAGLGLLAARPLLAQGGPTPPTPEVAVSRACAAAGGLAAFKNLGILGIGSKSEEVTQDGQVTKALKNFYFLAPGPVPGRLELPEHQVVAADDGSGGWAVVAGKADTRQATAYMVKRTLATSLFPLLLPFSLTWEGVAVTEVKAATVAGKPVWRLSVQVPRSFFDSPQIASSWSVFLDRGSFALVQAESPFTDLGKGVTADGMLFRWNEPTKVKGVTLHQEQRVTGLDEVGREKSHSRIDRFQFRSVPASEAEKLFANPIPPDQRPKPPAMQPPPFPPQGPPKG